jgi:mannose-1-phosphate guanylyltransferase/phosphomannomutase
MIPIVGQPMMDHILRLLNGHGFTEVVATLQFLASVVRNYFGDGSDMGISIAYSTEDEPLGTAGGVKNAEHYLDDTFLVISADTVTDIDLGAAVAFHKEQGAAATVVLKRVEDPLEFGIVIVGEDGRVERFLEKPGWGEVFSDTINTGVYVLEPEVLAHIPVGTEFDFAKDLFPLLLDKGVPMSGFVAESYWTDVGNLDAYLAVHRDILDGKVEIETPGFLLGENVWLGEGATVDPDASIDGPVFIGENSQVEAGAVLREYTVLGKGVAVKSGAFLHRAIVHDHAYVGPTASLRGCVLGKNSDVKRGARLDEGVVVADESHVGEGAVLNPNVKVFPFKRVEPGALVSKSIVWETGGIRSLFSQRGVAGLVNIDITPEMALRLALAFGGTMKKGSVATACRDATRSARIIKRAMVAGLNAAAIDCHDLEFVPTPVARYYGRSGRARGGFTVRTSPYDPQSVTIEFFDEQGIDVDPATQRAVERAFYRDDLRRAFSHEIGELTFPARGREYYTQGVCDAIDVAAIAASQPKVVVDYAFGGTSLTAPTILGRLGADILAVNSSIDEARVVLSREDEEEHLEELATLVASSGATVGAMFDSPGERLRLVDGLGRIVPLDRALLAYVTLVTEVSDRPRVAVPVATSRAVEEIVRSKGGEVAWTRISAAALSDASLGDGVLFAGAEGGGYIFPEFLPAYDALMGFAKLLELLTRTEASLADVVDALPPSHVVRVEVATPWETKGIVMRRLMERLNGERTITIDGVKAYRGRDWALVVPHPQEPLVQVWAEGDDPGASQALAEEFAALVEEAKG